MTGRDIGRLDVTPLLSPEHGGCAESHFVGRPEYARVTVSKPRTTQENLLQVYLSRYPPYPSDDRYTALLRKAAKAQPDAPSSPSKEPVSLPVIRYALYNLAFPDFAIEMTPQFLDLLTTVEFYRHLNLDRTRHLFPQFLEDNSQFKPSGELDPELEAELSQLSYELTGMRSLFWTIVVHCCQQVCLHLVRSLST